MAFFKAYIITKNKKSTTSFKDVPEKDLYTLEQVQSLPEYAGILAKDTILIDIDEFESSEILLKIVEDLKLCCRVYKTKRGKHFLFKNSGVLSNKTGCSLAIGLKADIKLGTRNSYEVIKFDGKEREILYDTAENEEAQPLPRWLFPVKSKMEFLNMDAGSGRNQGLFNYILTLQRAAFTTDEIRETIKIINKYVLKDPLSENELNVIIRDEAFKKPAFYIGKTFLHDKFAEYIKAEYHITKINGQLNIYNNGVYVPGYVEIEKIMIKTIPSIKRTQRAEVLSFLEAVCENFNCDTSLHLIAFKNGVYNLNTDTLEPFSPEYIITNKIPWDYNPNVQSEIVDSVLDKISDFDSSVRDLLEEVAGACLYRSNKIGGGKSVILFGDKENGKSTYIEMLDCVLDKGKNVSHIDLRELNDRFKTIKLYGKLANLGDDISGEYIANTAIFKKIATGQIITAEEKGKPVIDFEPYSTMIFSANEIPRMHDPTGAALRRLLIVPFNHKFLRTDPDYDPAIKYKLCSQEVMEYFIQLAIAGLKRVLTNKSYTIPAKVQQEKDNYELENNPILAFIEDCKNDMGEIEGIYNEPTEEVYLRYCVYCSRNNFQAVNKSTFVKRINKALTTESKQKKIKGKNIRVFEKVTV